MLPSPDPDNMPWWTRFSVIVVLADIALFVLGAIPGLPSPFARLEKTLSEAASEIRLQHEDVLAVTRMICEGVWRHSDEMRRRCAGSGGTR